MADAIIIEIRAIQLVNILHLSFYLPDYPKFFQIISSGSGARSTSNILSFFFKKK